MRKELNKHDINALVVDDENDICYLLSGILKKKHLRAICVSTLKEADVALLKKPTSIMFLDNNLPDGYGIDHISEIKKEHPDTKIIMITANDTQRNKDKALQAGADWFIGKPFNRDSINSVIDNLLDEEQACIAHIVD